MEYLNKKGTFSAHIITQNYKVDNENKYQKFLALFQGEELGNYGMFYQAEEVIARTYIINRFDNVIKTLKGPETLGERLKLFLSYQDAEEIMDETTKSIAWAIAEGTLPNRAEQTLNDMIYECADHVLGVGPNMLKYIDNLIEEFQDFYKEP